MRLPDGFPVRAAIVLVAGSFLFLGGVIYYISRDTRLLNQPPPVYTGIAPDVLGSLDELTRRVDAIVSRSTTMTEPEVRTVELPDGSGALALTARRPMPTIASELPSPPRPEFLPAIPAPLGEIVMRTDEMPAAIAVTNNGGLIRAGDDGLYLHTSDGSERLLLDVPIVHLQFDREGERLLAQQFDSIYLLSGDELDEVVQFSGAPPGKAWWDISGENRILLVKEELNLDASVRTRVRLEVYLLDVEQREVTSAGWNPQSSWAAIGSLPQLGYLWGHLSRPYQINPIPAPVVFHREGTPFDYGTSTERAADLLPVADLEHRLFWVRSHQRGGRSGRLFHRQIGDRNVGGVQLSGVPTYQVAVSPNGPHVVYTMYDHEAERFEIRRFHTDDIRRDSVRFEGYADSDRKLKSLASSFVEDLNTAFRRTAFADSVEDTEFGSMMDRPPDQGLITTMAAAARESIQTRFGMTLSRGPALAAEVDVLMDWIDSFVEEDPPLIIALGGLFAEALTTSPEWMLDGASNTLSMSYTKPVESDGLSFTAVSPFGIARERISGALTFRDAVSEIQSSEERPFYLVENFRRETLERVSVMEWQRAGIDPASLDTEKLLAVLQDHEDCPDAVSLQAIAIGREMGNQGVELLAALNLAASHPDSSEALSLLAQTLMDLFYTDQALRIYELATLLDPENSHLRILYGDCLLSLDALELALAQYELAGQLDEDEVFAEALAGRARLLQSLVAGRTAGGPAE